ncbi:MAG TPA: hypothetical protein VI409_02170 [Gaiellaceae bacterium]|nr:hypothetical protein [Gaiellaceae bacterium]
MALPAPRLLAALASGALLLAALGATGHGSPEAAGADARPTAARSIDAAPGTALRTERLARTAITWRGGPIAASTGETVNVQVSDALPPETATPESWAEFLVGLTHGPEISLLTTYIATLDEVQQLCGSRALGCYSRDQMVSLGETTVDGTTAEEVVRHEYGHHVAMHRLNTPWIAIDWGPKHWASSATVCSRVSRKEAFPGDEGDNYSQNPGEAWAEVYRLMDERKAGITTATWRIIAPSFYPDEAALQAAELDALEPWTAGRTTVFSRTFGKATKKVWWIPLSTPLDGDLRIGATVPTGGLHEVALVASNRTTVIRRAQWVGQRVKRLSGSVCGQRSLFVRVTRSGALGRVAVSVSTP